MRVTGAHQNARGRWWGRGLGRKHSVRQSEGWGEGEVAEVGFLEGDVAAAEAVGAEVVDQVVGGGSGEGARSERGTRGL